MLYISAVDLLFIKVAFLEYSSRGIAALGLYILKTNLKVKCRVMKC